MIAIFKIGDELKDSVTGYKGVVLGITYYATGCIHYGLQRKYRKDEKETPAWEWFDQSRLTLKKRGAVEFNLNGRATGGDFPNAPQT